MTGRTWLVTLMFIGWCAGSWYWYTCKIKGFCPGTVLMDSPSVVKESSSAGEQQAEGAETNNPDSIQRASLSSGLVGFKWNEVQVITGKSWTAHLDSFLALQEDGEVLSVSGPYDLNEENNSSFENLGIARAEAIKALLSGKIDPSKLRVSSHTDVLKGQGQERAILEDVRMSWMTNTESVKELKDGALIYFPYKSDKKMDDPGINQYLDKMISVLKNNDQTVEVVGHTDDKGSAGYNLGLGQERADAIRDLLIEKGLDGARIVASSKGESEPLAPNTTEENKAKNRRTEIKIR